MTPGERLYRELQKAIRSRALERCAHLEERWDDLALRFMAAFEDAAKALDIKAPPCAGGWYWVRVIGPDGTKSEPYIASWSPGMSEPSDLEFLSGPLEPPK